MISCIIFRNCSRLISCGIRGSSILTSTNLAAHFASRSYSNPVQIRKVLLLTKVTKYDFERSIEECADDEAQLVNVLQRKGVNVKWLLCRHNAHYGKVNEIEHALRSRGIDVRSCDRKSYTTDAIAWADVVLTAGGDGTFLLGASRIGDRNKLIIGLNTDPEYSCGHLCMPKWCTYDIKTAVDYILTGKYDHIWRSRLRTDVFHFRNQQMEMGVLDKHHQPTVEMWPPDTGVPSLQSSFARLSEGGSLVPENLRQHMRWTKIPLVALNEVYVGQALSARVSQYEICVNKETSTRQKSSGVIVATGTGSSSWYRHVCNIQPEEVMKLFELACNFGQGPPRSISWSDADSLSRSYNSNLAFEPASDQMVYVVRDPINNPVYKVEKPHGVVNSLQIRSLMIDAHLVLDGAYTFPFRYGSVASFSIHPSDALSTICLHKP